MSAPSCTHCGDEREVLYGATYAPCPACSVAAGRVVWMVGGGAALELLAQRGEVGSPRLDGAALAVGPGRAVLIDLAGDAAYDVPFEVIAAATGLAFGELLARARAALGRETEVLAAYEGAS